MNERERLEMELELMQLQATASKPRYPIMSQVNRGIANTVGGVVDVLNPLTPITGSAVDGLATGMRGIGVEVAEGEPQGAAQGAARGVGNAIGGLLPAAGTAKAIGAFGGVVGAAARDAYTALSTRLGAGLEMVAGGAAGGAETLAREQGFGPAGQTLAALGAGVAAPAAVISAPGAARGVAMAAPITGRIARSVSAAVTPYTREGATNVARGRVQGLAGGADRAGELAARIDPQSPLTPAQQTEDPALIGLERAAREADPTLADRMQERDAANLTRIRGEVEGIGDGASISATRDAVAARRTEVRKSIADRISSARKAAEERIAALGPKRSETDNSLIVAEEIRKSFNEAKAIEDSLWRAVPSDATVSTSAGRGAVARVIAETPRSQADDIPQKALRFLAKDGEYGDRETVAEMHGLYSALREDARNAMAGTQQNRNRARIANDIAEAILRDLEADDAAPEVARAISDARAYSRSMHEMFDQGATGRLLRRTVNTDEQIPKELTLDRTLSRGGAAADTAFKDIEAAVGTAGDVNIDMRDAVEDFLRRKFTDGAFTADGVFSTRGAATFMRNNAELLGRFPELRAHFAEAARDKTTAEVMAKRATDRVAAMDSRASAGKRFVDSPEGKEIETILAAPDPAKAAAEIIRQARRAGGSTAVDGVKSAFARHLIEKATPSETIRSVALREMMRDPRIAATMNTVLTADEVSRFRRIADELAKLDAGAKGGLDVGGVSNVEPPKIISLIARTFAARQGAKAGEGTSGASLLTANFASRRMQEIIEGLTNDRAARIIADAVENPELFRALLTDPASVAQSARAFRSLAPYVAGATAAATDD